MWLGQDVDNDNQDNYKLQEEWNKLSKGAKGNSIQGNHMLCLYERNAYRGK